MTKSATRKELADAAGVSVKTLSAWLKPIMPQLKMMGYKNRQKFFTPSMTLLICKHLDIITEKEEQTNFT